MRHKQHDTNIWETIWRQSCAVLLRFTIVVFLFFQTIQLFSQQTTTISGTITDGSSGETLAGATVYLKNNPNGAIYSNAYGFYSLPVSLGKQYLVVNYIGYNPFEIEIDISVSIRKNIQLYQTNKQLEEVVVTSVKRNNAIVSEKIGYEKLEIQSIKKIPILFGEQDILKTLTLTPGVKTMGEGSGGMYVRGGNNSHNLILLDESMVYNANHLLGFFSTFNSDAIKDVAIYKGTAGADYGGRLAAVMDVKMKEGNNKHYQVSGGIGLISSRLKLEGPIIKEKGSFLITARRTYADLFLKLSNDPLINNNQLYFYDINAKANYIFDDNNRVFVSAYMGRDVFRFIDRFGMDWGNITGTIRWNKIWNNKLFSNTSIIYSDYGYKVGIYLEDNSFSLSSLIHNVQIKQDFQYFLNHSHHLNFGAQITHHSIIPGQLETSSTLIQPFKLQEKFALENNLYVSHNWKPNDKWNVTSGIRGNIFSLLGGGDFYSYSDDGSIESSHYKHNEVVKTYFYLEPRLNIAHILNNQNSIKLSYTRHTQNLHLITNSTSSTPTDIWIPSSKNIKPQISDQGTLGYFLNFGDDTYQFSAETYYKWMQNQLDLKNGANIQANEYIENELLSGVGQAYGLEIMLKKEYGLLTGWIAYTLSRTENKIDGINNGKWYAARHDATHDVSIVGIYDINKRWTISGSWVFNTGNAVTFPTGKYEVNGETVLLYTERNASRMPNYHRMDIGATHYFKKTRKGESSLNISIYNLYAHKNAFTIDFEEDENNPNKINAVKTYLFTFVPSITYNFTF